MNMTVHFGELCRTLAWGQKAWFLLVHEPEPMVCKVKWSYIAYVRGVSEVVQPSFCFIKSCFCFRVESSVLAGRHQFQIEDGLKSINISGSYPAPQSIYLLWVINRKINRRKKRHLPTGPKVLPWFSLGLSFVISDLGLRYSNVVRCTS